MEDEKENTDNESSAETVGSDFKPLTTFTPEVDNPLEPLVDWSYGAVILGRGKRTHDKLGVKGTVQVGAVCEKQKGPKSLFGFKVRVDIEFPHIMFLCGKRGSGKSYSLGIFAEELARLRTGIGTVIIDPIGTFWSLKNSNKNPSEISALTRWGLEPQGFKNILIYTPIGFYNEYRGIVDKPFSISPADLTAEDWCMVFDVDRFKTQGLLIGDVLEKVRNGYTAFYKKRYIDVPGKPDRFSLGDIIQCIETDKGIISKDEGYAQATRRSLIARFTAAARWGLFATEGTPITELSVPNVVTVLDVSHPKIGDAKRSLIVGIIARKILEARLATSRLEDATAMGMTVQQTDSIPITWLLIDEAHLMLPHTGKTAASDALIEYAKLGRKPGCAMILATQRPAATNDEILSQVDLLIGHTLALQDDIAAFRKRVPAKLPSELGTSDFIRSIPVGVALLADQRTQKRTMLVQLRPRLTHHAGRAAAPVMDSEPDADATKGAEIEEGEEALPETQISELEGTLAAPDKIDKSKVPETFVEIQAPKPLKPTLPLNELISDMDEESELGDAEEKAPGPPEKVPAVEKPTKKRKKPELKPVKKVEEIEDTAVEPPEAEEGHFEWEGGIYPPQDLELGDGGLVLLRTKNAETAFELYRAVAKQFKTPPLCITRTHPKKVMKYFDTTTEPPTTFWLSKSTGDNNIGPTNLEKLAHQLNRHMKSGDGAHAKESGDELQIQEAAKKSSGAGDDIGKPSIAILEGLEYLVSNNDFNKVLRFIEALHEKALLNKALGILPVNPAAMDERELQMLEREMDFCLTYTSSKPSKPSKPGEVPAAAGPAVPASPPLPEPFPFVKGGGVPTTKAIKRMLLKASKQELTILCMKLGLPKTGTKEDMYKRIIKYMETHPGADKTELKKAGLAGEEDLILTGLATGLKDDLKNEYKKLESEREKLRIEREKLLREKLQRAHELEMAKLKAEQEKLLKIESDLTKREEALAGKELEYEERMKELERIAKAALKDRSGAEAELKPILAFEEETEIKGDLELVEGPEVGPLTIMPKIEHITLMEAIQKALDKSLFGRKKEEITSVQPVLVPLLKTRVKVPGGKLRRKEYVNDMIWDTISGEQVIDYKSGLKRTEGLDILYELSDNQIKTIRALGSLRGRDIKNVVKETGLKKSQVSSALNKLVAMGLVERKVDAEGKIEQYKRKRKLKLPNRPERVLFELPEMKPRRGQETILQSHFDLKKVQKILVNIVPNSKIVKSENIFYPYFMVELTSKDNKSRTVLIDAVSGVEDKVLGNNL
ncbi:MAG: DUF835 domain-containing protein [Thermoplasmata archaeon]|nr:MAG: DUF835 domain-containing protein [Thermoplasmata archaeon]